MTFTIKEVAEAFDRIKGKVDDKQGDAMPKLTLGEKGWHRGSYNGVEYTQATLHSEDEAYDVYLTPNGDWITTAIVGEPAEMFMLMEGACCYLYLKVQVMILEKAQAEVSPEPELPVDEA